MTNNKQKGWVRSGVALLAVLTLVASVTAEARPGRPGFGNHGGHTGVLINDHMVKANLERLMEATKEVVKADRLNVRGRDFQAKTKLLIAGFRVRLVLATIKYTGIGEEAQEALYITADKLRDRYLPVEDKIEIALDCLSVAIGQLAQQISRRNTFEGAAEALKFIKLVAPTHRFGPVENVLVSVLEMVSEKRGQKARAIEEALEIALEKASSPYLPPAQKLYFVLDCVGVAQNWLAR